jgi:oligoribonuclease
MDLEMTGLDPKRHVIVEIATLVTDDNLEVLAEGPDLVVSASEEQLAEMDDVVRRMHAQSGLLDLVGSSGVSLARAGELTLEFVRRWAPEPGTAPLCGNSIGVDRRFLRHYLPDLEAHFHYRSIDVSTVKELCRRWNPQLYARKPRKLTAHRALDDIRESVAELAFYRAEFFRLPPDGAAPGAGTGPAAGAAAGAAAPPSSEPPPTSSRIP